MSYVQKEIAQSITLEQGKTLADAEGDVHRGLRKYRIVNTRFLQIHVKLMNA